MLTLLAPLHVEFIYQHNLCEFAGLSNVDFSQGSTRQPRLMLASTDQRVQFTEDLPEFSSIVGIINSSFKPFTY